ncbi:MAG: mismatch-specific DNA-glycosylase [Rhizobiales bacterium]|nr:mismatch-specific DNA-glycosylase [Hyphomicrobiales bacterium]
MTFDRLPDLLAPNLRLVFVGTAASHRSAAEGAYYAHPGNRFWRTLHEVGLTPRLYAPSEFRDLLALGIGFTDMSKRGSGMDHNVAADEFDAARFVSAIKKFRPRVIAFTSKKAASVCYSVPTQKIRLGLQAPQPDFPSVFVLPSPSGAATRYWDIAPWRALAAFIKQRAADRG